MAIFLLMGWISFIIIVGLCWYILGAVLNPDVFLPYAAAAVTLISFVANSLKQISKLRTEVLKKVKEYVWTKLRGLMTGTLDGIVTN